MHQVVSSNILAIGYDEAESNVHVQFLNNTEYVYKGVPEHEFSGLFKCAIYRFLFT